MEENIRNFVIIAHIDHGKSTLADRFLEITGTIEPRRMKAQYLDQLELERERGITIKMAPVRMIYKAQTAMDITRTDTDSGLLYILNLIDTPGHPDFSYEVSRAFKAVEGAVLLVDVSKGIQAQTLANFEMAKKFGLKIIGAVNKIDLNPPHLENVVEETASLLNCPKEEILRISAKTGEGVRELLEKIIKEIPAPQTYADNFPRPSALSKRNSAINAKALIFDSFYDDHKGVIAFVRVFGGDFKTYEETRLISANIKFKIKETGYFSPQLKPSGKIATGEIGYIATGIKEPDKLRIGDTIGDDEALSGYEEPQPRVFVSFFPEQGDKYEELKKSFQRLKLNDPALKLEPDFNEVLGRGFKIGFLGKLHFEITAERLEQEFGIRTINSFPSVAYKIRDKIIENIENLPDDLSEIQEPMINLEIISPNKYLGSIFQIKELFRMDKIETRNVLARQIFSEGRGGEERVLIKAKMPLAELISDFDDKLKSITEGFASFSYELDDYKKADLEKLEILVNGYKVPGLTRVIFKKKVEYEAREMVKKLKEILPRQQFTQAIQAKAGGRVIARETVSALKKDVTGYLYGGDRTRKMKLWEKQKKGKKKLAVIAGKQSSGVRIPPEVFKKMLKSR